MKTITEYLAKNNISISVTKIPDIRPPWSDGKNYGHTYQVKLSNLRNSSFFKFFDSICNKEKGLKPEIKTIIENCLSEYHCPDDFKEFCGEFGYDPKEKKSLKTWRRCLVFRDKVRSIITEEQAKEMWEIISV